ncbi:transposable element Tc3 transposase [Trichonephila clavipes]|nr:transposable element Tc3 transposase [Trichonephila clavipes]
MIRNHIGMQGWEDSVVKSSLQSVSEVVEEIRIQTRNCADILIVYGGTDCNRHASRIITHILKKNMQITGNHQMARMVHHNDESHKGSIWIIFYEVELLDDWNVGVPSWKYPRILESPRVSSPGFDNDSKMMFRGAMGADFLFMDDNTRPHLANIVDECLQSEDITRMDWPA